MLEQGATDLHVVDRHGDGLELGTVGRLRQRGAGGGGAPPPDLDARQASRSAADIGSTWAVLT
ncbi:hypothetical protein GCM10009797_10950 [Nocardioides hwasunensis]